MPLRLIRATVAAVSVPVTVKMRLGWDEDEPQRSRIGSHRGSRRRPPGDRAWTHTQPVLQGRRRLGAVRRGARAVVRFPWWSTAIVRAQPTHGACWRTSGADAVMIGRACGWTALDRRAISPTNLLGVAPEARPASWQFRSRARPLRHPCFERSGATRACGMPASTWPAYAERAVGTVACRCLAARRSSCSDDPDEVLRAA